MSVMSESRKLPLRAAGISWYRREDYARALAIMDDAHVLPRTYDEWSQKAERQEGEWKAQGIHIVRAIIDPETFPEWCRARGLNVDAKGRTAFASFVAMQQVKTTH